MQPAIEVLTDAYIKDCVNNRPDSQIVSALKQAVCDLCDGSTLIVSGQRQLAFATLFHSFITYKEPERADDIVKIQSCMGVNSYMNDPSLSHAMDYADAILYGNLYKKKASGLFG